METILVTGGAGFIGSAFIRQWIAEETAAVVNLDKLTYAGNLASLEPVAQLPRYHFVRADIANREVLEQVLADFSPRAIVNLAAETHVDRSIDVPAAFLQTNVIGTFNLLDAATAYWRGLPPAKRAAFRFLQVSTDEVFGSLDDDDSSIESSPFEPNSPYSASKAAADHFVRAYHRTYGLPTVVTHSSNNYGPYQFPEKLIPLMALNALDGRRLPIFGDGTQIRDWVYVDDHCRALRAVLANGRTGDEYNIGGNCERTNLAVVEAICAAIDRLQPQLPHIPCRSLIQFVADRPGHDKRYSLDSTKIRRELGWRPLENFQSGLERTVKWYILHQQLAEMTTHGIYRRERLGLQAEAGADGTTITIKESRSEAVKAHG